MIRKKIVEKEITIPHMEVIKLKNKTLRNDILELVEDFKENIEIIESSQIRKIYDLGLNTNYNIEELLNLIDHQLERRTLKEKTKQFYNWLKKVIEKKTEDKVYIKTLLYEILLYKKSLRDKKEEN